MLSCKSLYQPKGKAGFCYLLLFHHYHYESTAQRQEITGNIVWIERVENYIFILIFLQKGTVVFNKCHRVK